MAASKISDRTDLHSPVSLLRNARVLFCLLLVAVSGRQACAFSPAEKPEAPATIESAYGGPGAITVYWSPPAGGGSTGYRLFRDETLIASPAADARSFRENNLKPGAAYHYRVEATYADKPASSSHTVTEKLPPLLPALAHYDVVIVMASSAGVAAAVTAARKGLHVALLEPTDRLGGIMSNGLCATDMRRAYHSTGFFEEFRQKVQQYYGSGEGMQYEPHVVNNVLKEMVGSQPNIDIFYHVRAVGVRARGNTVLGVHAVSSDTGTHTLLLAPITIDADPTGDVTAWAGCRCRVGREKRTPEEPHAGVIHYARAKDVLLPGSTGHGDRRIQAYTYLCVVKDYGEGADRSIPKPPGYRESDYIHGPSWKDSWAVTSGAMPGNKYELNQHPQGNDLQEINYNWPWESQKGRQRIEAAFRNHALGYLYYIQTHEKRPNLGLPDDEFPENGGFPETLYVREARRVVGLVSLNEKDVTLAGERLRPDSAGVGDYPMDSHAVRPKTDWTSPDMGEGEWWLYRYTPWYQVPMGVVIPADRDGLLVAEAVSATHVGYGTLRMEPVRMQMGELCGNLAAISRWTGVWPRRLPPSMVQDELMQEGQRIFWHSDVAADVPDAAAIQTMGVHGFWADKDFESDKPVLRSEAWSALRRLQWMEAAQSGDKLLLNRAKKSRWTPPSAPTSTLTRGVLAEWLVQIQQTLHPGGWSPGSEAEERSGFSSPYADLSGESATVSNALILWQHQIHTDDWKDARFDPTGHPLFEPDRPVTRSDFAEALFLAQRDFPSPFYHPVGAIVSAPKELPARVP